jgi:hypothetical protein
MCAYDTGPALRLKARKILPVNMGVLVVEKKNHDKGY